MRVDVFYMGELAKCDVCLTNYGGGEVEGDDYDSVVLKPRIH